MLCPGENERNEQDDDYGSRDQDRPDVASDQVSFSHLSRLYPWPRRSQTILPAKESSATVLGNRYYTLRPFEQKYVTDHGPTHHSPGVRRWLADAHTTELVYGAIGRFSLGPARAECMSFPQGFT